jgi:hypothetical protein
MVTSGNAGLNMSNLRTGLPGDFRHSIYEPRMTHFNILGWLWLLFGGFWCLITAWAFLMCGASIIPQQPPGVMVSSRAWWEGVICNTLECLFFLGSAFLGVSLLRRWRRAHIMLGALGSFMLAVYLILVSFGTLVPPATLVQKMLYLSPIGALALYSLIAVLLCKYEPKVP